MATATREPEELDLGQPGTNAVVPNRNASKPRYRYRLIVGRHVEDDPDAEPDKRTGIVPDRVFQGPTTFLSVVPDLHIRFPNKFATPEGTNLVAGTPEGSLVFDPSCETLEDFVRRAQDTIAINKSRPTARGISADSPTVATNTAAQAGQSLPGSNPDNPAQSAAAVLPAYARSEKNAPPDFEKMTLKQMRDYAAAEEIDVSGAETVTALRDLLRKARVK